MVSFTEYKTFNYSNYELLFQEPTFNKNNYGYRSQDQKYLNSKMENRDDIF